MKKLIHQTGAVSSADQVLHVTWTSGMETLDLIEIARAAGVAAPALITTMEIRANDLIVLYKPVLKVLSENKFTLTYDHPGTWLSGENNGEDADGDLGTASYTRREAALPAPETWTCSWKGDNGTNSRPRCSLSAPNASRVYAEYKRAVRHGAFRASLLNHQQRCAISNETEQCVLEAAHILPVGDKGDDQPTNGIVLRKDLHALFDAGHIVIDNDGRFSLKPGLPAYEELIAKAKPWAAAQVPAVLRNIVARNARREGKE